MSQKPKKKNVPPAGGMSSQERGAPGSRPSSVAATAVLADDAEPTVVRAPAPAWIFVLLVVLIYWAMTHLDRYGGGFNDMVYGPYSSYKQLADLAPKSGPEMLIARGAALFAVNCQPCHQATGMGSPGLAPPLVGSEWVLGPPKRLVRIPNNGLQGPITIKGQQWNASMAALGGSLPDEDLAAILSYIRNTWGNSAPVVTPELVKGVRAELGARPRDGTAPWSADELMKVE